MKKPLSVLIVLIMVLSLIPVTYAEGTAGKALKSAFFPSGISKPEKGYIQTTQHLNKDGDGKEDYEYGYLGTDYSVTTYMPDALYRMLWERDKLGDDAFFEKYGLTDVKVIWQIDMRLDNGSWQYEDSWDDGEWCTVRDGYAYSPFLRNNTDFDDIRNTDCEFSDIIGSALITGTNHRDGEEGAYFDFGSHRLGFKVRYGVFYDNFDDEEEREIVYGPWSDEFSYGKGGNQTSYSKPTSFPAPTISDLEFVYDEWDNDYDISFMIDGPVEIEKDVVYFETYGGGHIDGIEAECSINNGDWQEVGIVNNWWERGKRWISGSTDSLGFNPGDNVKFRARLAGYTNDGVEWNSLYSPWSNTIEAGAKVVKELPSFADAPVIASVSPGTTTPTSILMSIRKPDTLKEFVSALSGAADKAAFLSDYNLTDFSVYAQVKFAIDDPAEDTGNYYWDNGEKEIENSAWEYVRIPISLSSDSDEFEILNIGSATADSWTNDVTGWKNVIKDGTYTVNGGKIEIDYRDHTVFLWVRYFFEYKAPEDTDFRHDTSLWTARYDYGQEYVQPTSLAAPVISNLVQTDEKRDNYPYITLNVSVPDSVLAAQREAVKYGDNVSLSVEACVGEGEFATVENTWNLEEGTYRFLLSSATDMKTIPDNTPLQVRAKLYYNDYNYEGAPATVSSDYSGTLQLGLTGLHSHSWQEKSNSATCTEDGVITYECPDCHETKTEPSLKLGHDYGEYVIEKEPTYTDKGLKVYTCRRCGHRDEYELDLIPHTHEWIDAGLAPTCTEDGYSMQQCRICKETGEKTVLQRLGHDFAKDFTVDVQPTYHSEGSKSRHCIRCSEKTDITPIEMLKCDHEYKESIVDPTCTADGYTLHECPKCKDSYKTDETPALGHAWSKEWTVDVQPTLDNAGQKSFHCLRCGAIDEKSKTVLPQLEDTTSKFKDIKSNKWYKDSIDFVVGRELMNGTSGNAFEPETPMNRAMLVTVLYRIEGSPAVNAKTPFTDLKQDWYKDAVAWAYENQVVNGMSETKFAPTDPITREQMAAILYRYSNYKEYDTTARADIKSFPDYAKISSYAREPLQWAVKAEVITGTSGADGKTYVDPKGNATRAQVATILMRYCKLMGI